MVEQQRQQRSQQWVQQRDTELAQSGQRSAERLLQYQNGSKQRRIRQTNAEAIFAVGCAVDWAGQGEAVAYQQALGRQVFHLVVIGSELAGGEQQIYGEGSDE